LCESDSTQKINKSSAHVELLIANSENDDRPNQRSTLVRPI